MKDHTRRQFIQFCTFTAADITLFKGNVFAQTKADKIVETARKYLGVPYTDQGRMIDRLPGLDCMGLVYVPNSQVYNEDWKKYGWNPGELVKNSTLGIAVKGLDGILMENLNLSKLKKADTLHFLNTENTGRIDIPTAKINGSNYWTWTMGIYIGDKGHNFIHAEPQDKVREDQIQDMPYPALLATRR